MQAERWRPMRGRHSARSERRSGSPEDTARPGRLGRTPAGDPAPQERPLDTAPREAGRSERWLRHPGTVDRVAAVIYESRTGRRWMSAEEVDRIGYIANARAVLEFIAAEGPSS